MAGGAVLAAAEPSVEAGAMAAMAAGRKFLFLLRFNSLFLEFRHQENHGGIGSGRGRSA
jgi:hypothetical protein